jgi:hypothetical protein
LAELSLLVSPIERKHSLEAVVLDLYEPIVPERIEGAG